MTVNIQKLIDAFNRLVRAVKSRVRSEHVSIAQLCVLAITTTVVLLNLRINLNRRFDVPNVVGDLKLNYAEWIRPFFFPQHRFTIYTFVISLLALGALALSVRFIRRGAEPSRQQWRMLFGSVALLAFAGLASLTYPGSPLVIAVGALAIAGLVAAPLFPAVGAAKPRLLLRPGLAYAALIVAIADFGVTITPYAFNMIPFMRNAFDISTTIKGVGDELDYVNRNHLWGNQQLPDARVAAGKDAPCLPGNRIGIEITEDVKSALKLLRRKYYINNTSGDVCFAGRMSESERDLLKAAAPSSEEVIDAALVANLKAYDELDNIGLTENGRDFLKATSLSTVQTIHELEDAFHHHFQFLAPLNELSLGRPLNEINSTYGLVIVPMLYVLKAFGGVTYQGMLFLYGSSFLLYYAGFLLLVAWATRNIWATATAALAGFAAVKALGVHVLFTSVGYSPLRHFLDIGVMALVLCYLRSARAHWLFAAIVVGLANIWLDKFLGGLSVVALIGLLFVRQIVERIRPVEIVGLLILMVGLGVEFALASKLTAPNYYAAELMAGVWGFPVPSIKIVLVLGCFFGLLVSTLWSAIREPKPEKTFLIFAIGYAVLWYSYWMAIPNYGHWYAALPYSVLAGVLWIGEVMPDIIGRWQVRSVARIGVLLLAGAFWIVETIDFAIEAFYYRDHFARHEIFKWDSPQMAISSTMAPDLFNQAAKTIDDNSAGPGIYILSQRDTVLTFLARRYSLMPNSELYAFMYNVKTKQVVIDAIKDQKPEILFVDSCIECSTLPWMLTRNLPGIDPVYSIRILQKVSRTEQLQDVFRAIKDDYEKAQVGPLITVYRRK